MIWKLQTGFLLTMCVVICVWMYLRDRTTPVVLQPGPAVAQASNVARADGDRLLNVLASPPACGRRCGVEVYGSSSANRWRVALTGPSWRRCFAITLSEFGYADARGFSGVRSVTCPA
jgi:hypothetical protein